MKALLLKTLHEEIPITKAMGIDVLKANTEEVIIQAPLALNINHKETGFGGSLNTVAILACWSMLFVRLKEAGIYAHIVIQSSQIRYLRPVTHDLIAHCTVKDENRYEKMIKSYLNHKKGRMILEAVILDEGEEAVRFQGEYVIHS